MSSKRCIVLMPFELDRRARFEFFQQCGRALGLDVERVDTATFSGNIPTAIARALASADLVLADLSGPNPNVSYEVAIAQCLGQKLVLVTDDRNTVPFDLQAYRIELVRDCVMGEADALTSAMRGTLVATYRSGPLGGLPVFGQRVFVRRTTASAIDTSIVVVLSSPFIGWWESLLREIGRETAGALPDVVSNVVLGLLVMVVYYTVTTRWLGASLGQRVLDLKVVNFEGKELALGHSLARALATWVSILTYGVGYFWALQGPAFRTFHDILSRSMIVRRSGRPRRAPV